LIALIRTPPWKIKEYAASLKRRRKNYAGGGDIYSMSSSSDSFANSSYASSDYGSSDSGSSDSGGDFGGGGSGGSWSD
jgi:hypothetical protein